jgi:hypothetical protein
MPEHSRDHDREPSPRIWCCDFKSTKRAHDRTSEHSGQQPLRHIEEEAEKEEPFAEMSAEVGRPDVTRADCAYIDPPGLADQQSKRDRPEQIRTDGKEPPDHRTNRSSRTEMMLEKTSSVDPRASTRR